MGKKFEVEWSDGSRETLEGNNIANALMSAGYSTIGGISEWKEIKDATPSVEKFVVSDEQKEQIKWLLEQWRDEADSDAEIILVFTRDKQYHLYTDDAGKMIGKKGVLVKKYSELISNTLNRTVFIDVKICVNVVELKGKEVES